MVLVNLINASTPLFYYGDALLLFFINAAFTLRFVSCLLALHSHDKLRLCREVKLQIRKTISMWLLKLESLQGNSVDLTHRSV